MKQLTKDEILENTLNAQGFPITAYVSKDGFVWKMFLKAMQEYSDQNTKPLLDEIAELKASKSESNVCQCKQDKVYTNDAKCMDCGKDYFTKSEATWTFTTNEQDED